MGIEVLHEIGVRSAINTIGRTIKSRGKTLPATAKSQDKQLPVTVAVNRDRVVSAAFHDRSNIADAARCSLQDLEQAVFVTSSISAIGLTQIVGQTGTPSQRHIRALVAAEVDDDVRQLAERAGFEIILEEALSATRINSSTYDVMGIRELRRQTYLKSGLELTDKQIESAQLAWAIQTSFKNCQIAIVNQNRLIGSAGNHSTLDHACQVAIARCIDNKQPRGGAVAWTNGTIDLDSAKLLAKAKIAVVISSAGSTADPKAISHFRKEKLKFYEM